MITRIASGFLPLLFLLVIGCTVALFFRVHPTYTDSTTLVYRDIFPAAYFLTLRYFSKGTYRQMMRHFFLVISFIFLADIPFKLEIFGSWVFLVVGALGVGLLVHGWRRRITSE